MYCLSAECSDKTTESSECARPPSAPNVLTWDFGPVKKPYHPRDLVIWGFCPGKKAISLT